jgi:histidine triad (HIT) family protein
MAESAAGCLFCQIVAGAVPAAVVFEDGISLGFLDQRPLFPGHTLLIPKDHYETLAELPRALLDPLFANTQLLASAVEQALAAEGSFVAINNRVSQSVPHLHVHIAPRRKGDGLRGFFWPRQKYKDAGEMEKIRKSIQETVERLQSGR